MGQFCDLGTEHLKKGVIRDGAFVKKGDFTFFLRLTVKSRFAEVLGQQGIY
ncbi:MAG: hypothetical protein ACLFR1_13990 [Spirochaetia bacterium]